jgi:L-ascorbate 6-phosphate lactonase
MDGTNMSLIQPFKQGVELIREINDTRVEQGIVLWFLGQSGFCLKSGNVILYIDPYLSDSLAKKYAGSKKEHIRLCASPLLPTEVTNATLVLSTHKHSDHMDPETIPPLLSASPNAKYIFPKAHEKHVHSMGISKERCILADVDKKITHDDIEVIPIPAAHELFDFDEKTGYPYMGYIIRIGGIVLYHSGDTIPYLGLIERLVKHKTDIVLLPINGRDVRRHELGTPGNCTIQEALTIAICAGAKLMIPHHYDLFQFNSASIEDFKSWSKLAYPQQQILTPAYGARVTCTRRESNGINSF